MMWIAIFLIGAVIGATLSTLLDYLVIRDYCENFKRNLREVRNG